MRHVAASQLASTLQQGATLEQFLGGAQQAGQDHIRWIELVPSRAGIEVWDFSVPAFDEASEDLGSTANAQLKPVAILAEPAQALDFAQSELGAKPNRWVYQGVSPIEFLEILRTGQPAEE